ncbi:MAG: radical SAM protein [Candidatus Omnitrophica bacterium]|nr:radical SAM protein [Candidatus Omnitrophota bacterium]
MQRTTKNILLISTAGRCKSNSALSSRLIKYFVDNEYSINNKISDADLILINSCGFRKKDIRNSKEAIKNAIKKRNPHSKIVAVGCLNKINRSILKNISSDILIIDDLSDFDSLIEAKKPFASFKNAHFDKNLFNKIVWQNLVTLEHDINSMVLSFVTKTIKRLKKKKSINLGHLETINKEENFNNTLYVEIGSGCVSNCSYCVIKKAHGSICSRPIYDILIDIKEGYREGISVNLVATDCGSYGIDKGLTLFDLIDAINNDFPGIPIDLCYLNPRWLEEYSEKYYKMFNKYNISSANIPVQSGSDRIIKLMNRKYNVANILKIVNRIKEISPTTMLWTHVIIGYPTEAWKEFRQTIKIVKNFHLTYCFNYSDNKEDSKRTFLDTLQLIIKMIVIRLAIYKKMLGNLFSSLVS